MTDHGSGWIPLRGQVGYLLFVPPEPSNLLCPALCPTLSPVGTLLMGSLILQGRYGLTVPLGRDLSSCRVAILQIDLPLGPCVIGRPLWF